MQVENDELESGTVAQELTEGLYVQGFSVYATAW